jgi:hypothetical protein
VVLEENKSHCPISFFLDKTGGAFDPYRHLLKVKQKFRNKTTIVLVSLCARATVSTNLRDCTMKFIFKSVVPNRKKGKLKMPT